jgi:ATP phosphoribosyltransferase regulatory subunit
LLLRPDVTAQVARIVAMGMMGQDLPLRLCYRTTVFRYEPEHAGRDREIFQVGAELIGTDNAATDAEILALMIECLKELGLPAFSISLGHVGFIKGLLARTGMSPEGRKRAEHAAARKDLPRLEEILRSERITKKDARAVLEAPGLYGRDEVLKRGQALAGGHPELEVALARLTEVYELLVANGMKEHLVLDLGEFRGFDYYDGIAFDVFTKGVGCELGGGGRYDHLIGRFGRAVPSTGFALDVDRLFQALEGVEETLTQPYVDFLVSGRERDATRLFSVARLLREAGYRVVQGTVRAHRADPIHAATEEGRQVDASAVVILGMPKVAADEVLVIGHPLTGLEASSRKKTARKEGASQSARHRIKIKDLPVWAAKSPE